MQLQEILQKRSKQGNTGIQSVLHTDQDSGMGRRIICNKMVKQNIFQQ